MLLLTFLARSGLLISPRMYLKEIFYSVTNSNDNEIMIKQYMSALFEESTLKKPKEIGSSNESQALRAASKKERKKEGNV